MNFGLLTRWEDKESIDDWLKRERAASEKVENPTCPYCQKIHTEWPYYSKLSEIWEIQNYKFQCESCDKEFLVDKDTKIRFESRPLETESDKR